MLYILDIHFYTCVGVDVYSIVRMWRCAAHAPTTSQPRVIYVLVQHPTSFPPPNLFSSSLYAYPPFYLSTLFLCPACLLSHLSLSLPCRREIEESRREAEKDGIKVPSTLEEYCQQYRPVAPSESQSDFDLYDEYDENDDYICSDEEDDVMDDGEEEDNEDIDDSGCNGNG